MNTESKKKLEQYKNNELPNTEGVEQSIIREAIRHQDRAKWAQMLSEDGIQKDEKIVPLVTQTEENRPTLIRRLAPFAVGLAATIAFLVYIYTPSTDSFDNMILKNPKSGVEVRMGSNDEIEAWKKASAAYNNKQYEDAVKNISQITQPTSEQSFYLALSLIYQKQPDFSRSSTIFKTLVDKNDATYVDEARWYLAYSYYKMGQKQEAQSILKSIINNKGYNYEKAQILMNKELK